MKPPFPGEMGDREWQGMLGCRALRGVVIRGSVSSLSMPSKSTRCTGGYEPLAATNAARRPYR